jgi:hypothetical protein
MPSMNEVRTTHNTILETAKSRVSQQPYLPLSPVGVTADGDVMLCAAACLAFAGLQVLGSVTEARRFQSKLAETRDSQIVEAAFARLGWKEEACHDFMNKNDASPSSARKDLVLGMLGRISAEELFA